MGTEYAVFLHTVNTQNVCMAGGLHRSDNAGMPANQYKRDVGARLRLAIEALDLSFAEVARELDESPSKLGNWMRGTNFPDPWFVRRFCDRYGLTTDWLYRGQVSGVASDVAAALWRAKEASPAGSKATADPEDGTA